MLKVGESETLTGNRLLLREVVAYHLIEDLTAFIIYFMVVFSPWAFGTTEPWSIWTMNAGAFVLGVLLLLKLAIRWRNGYRTEDGLAAEVEEVRNDENYSLLTPQPVGSIPNRSCFPESILARTLAIL